MQADNTSDHIISDVVHTPVYPSRRILLEGRGGQGRWLGSTASMGSAVEVGCVVCLLCCMNGLRKWTSGIVCKSSLIAKNGGPLFLAINLLSQPVLLVVISQEPSLLKACSWVGAVWVMNLCRMAARAVGWSFESQNQGTRELRDPYRFWSGIEFRI